MSSKTGKTKLVTINHHAFNLTHLNRIWFPESTITKGMVVNYYRRIAPIMFPYIANRLLTMKRFPEGIEDEGFFHKNAPDHFPDWITRKAIKRSDGKTIKFVVCTNEATLVYIANYGCITPHISLSRIDKLNYPDKLIFDLDPSKNTFACVQKGAKLFYNILNELELPSFVMTTGSRGLHIIIPIKRLYTFDKIRLFAAQIGKVLLMRHDDVFTMEIRKRKRGEKIFIDILRNALNQTSVAPYSVRALSNAPIATPIAWHEIGSKQLTSTRYTIKNIFKRVAKVGDIWSGIESHAVSIDKAEKKLKMLLSA